MKKKLLMFFSISILIMLFVNIPIVKANPAYEDFTTYIEVEPNNSIQKTTYHIDHATDRDEDAYLYSYKGENFFTNFIHDFDARYLDTALRPVGIVYMLANDLDDFVGLQDDNKTAVCIFFYRHIGDDYRLTLRETWNSTEYSDTWYATASELNYKWKFFNVVKLGDNLTVTIYSTDADRTNEENEDYVLSLILHADHKFSYIFPCNTYNDGYSGYTSNDDIENLDLHTPEWYVTFYNNSGGILRVNNVTITNGTKNSYPNNTILELIAIVEGNLTYGFANFTWDSNYNISNPYNLTVSKNLTLWCYFGNISGNGVDTNGSLIVGLILGLGISGILGIAIIAVVVAKR